ncbi:MBL fold metallo-hydrolase [Streptomyces sp. NBC_00207]|uniref:MBL fold metallo-hydrolase n=1 Tax=unclassified Streptomyces TaxID=2593676 RepID=UPI0028871D81|nr:MBL fold metallo-hydrolase [Streptomyces sp. DSM 41633]
MTNENTQSIWLGDVEVIRVREWQGFFTSAHELVPDSARVWEDNGHWLAPDHWEPEQGQAVMALQSWVLRSAGQTILIDTGVGNGRERPHSPHFHHWQTDFLGALAGVGVHPEDVDIVVNTHLHADHVGWNTHDVGGEWAPTFPHARYLIPAADDFHFGPGNSRGKGRNPDDGLVYEDSIAPVHRAGQALLWDGTHRIDEHLTLEPAPGHTPGSSVLRLESQGERAVFVGDLMHSPVQIVQPSCNSCFCLDPVQAAASRRRVLQRAADERELVVPAHFAGPGALNVRATADAFAPAGWAPWSASHDTAAPQHS